MAGHLGEDESNFVINAYILIRINIYLYIFIYIYKYIVTDTLMGSL